MSFAKVLFVLLPVLFLAHLAAGALHLSGQHKASGALDIRGSVLVTAGGDPPAIKTVQFEVAPAAGSPPIEVGEWGSGAELHISITDGKSRNDGLRYETRDVAGDRDATLTAGEEKLIDVNVTDAPAVPANAGDRIVIEVRKDGETLMMATRTLPLDIRGVMQAQ